MVADMPGLTRDRQYGYATLGDRRVLLVDTGGLGAETELGIEAEAQTWRAVQEAEHVFFIVDARTGLVPADEDIAKHLRVSGKPIWLLVNKSEGLPEAALAEFHRLGFERVFSISAARGSGIPGLARAMPQAFPSSKEEVPRDEHGLTVTVIGRPNVGKSTLVNRLLGEQRVLTSQAPGTTRDAVRIPLTRDESRYVLVDTAGLRRRASIESGAERLGVLAALRALEGAVVAIVVTDASEGVTTQDQRLVRLALERGRGVVVALNKWDHLPPDRRRHALATAERLFAFAPFVTRVQLSALHGTGVGELMAAVDETGAAVRLHLPTPELNRVLAELVGGRPPPVVGGRRVKLRYAHQGGVGPPRIVVHGTQAGRLPAAYRRYLASGFRDAFRLTGVPLQLEFRSPPNPYAGRRRRVRPRGGA